MRQLRMFIYKEFCHIGRDRRTMLILLVMPVVLVVLFGFALSTEMKGSKVAVLDPSDDIITRDIIEQFDANHYFTVVDYLTSTNEIETAFKNGKIDLAVVFSDNFASEINRPNGSSIQLITDGTEPNQAAMRVSYAQNILASAFSKTTADITGDRRIRIVPEIKMLYNPQQRSEYNFVPGVMGMIMMIICAMMSSIAIVREKETGTMEVLLASPLHPSCIIIAKMAPYFVISCLNFVTILVLSTYVLDIPIAGSLFGLSCIALTYIAVALALGLLISTLVKSQLAAMLISGIVLMLPAMLLSGTIFPIESMPQWLQYISAIVPARWFASAVRKIMIQGVDLYYVWHEFAILCIMIAVLLIAAIRKFKIRLE